MSELTDMIWTECYRPKSFDDLILEGRDLILKYMRNPKSLPSFIFHSVKPGTGKTTCAKLVADKLGCDMLKLNASDERGIDTIRDKIKIFSQSLTSQYGIKRMVFLDESDYLTTIAQASLRNIIEEMSSNCFFVFTANDISKIIEPIRSRCIVINFEYPNKNKIKDRLEYICIQEKMDNIFEANLIELVETYYPDIRSMILCLQSAKLEKRTMLVDYEVYKQFLEAVKTKNIDYIYETVYSGKFNIMGFNKWFFCFLFQNHRLYGFEKTVQISNLLADTEKNWNLGTNLPIVFINNMLKIGGIL